MPNITTCKEYRNTLGFSNQENLKKHFKATDIVTVNWCLIENYNQRIIDIFAAINNVLHTEIKLLPQEFEEFKSQILRAYDTLKEYQIIETKFTNNGRARESVYYNWMRGFAVGMFFKKTISRIFNVEQESVVPLGKDNLELVKTTQNPNDFQKEALADFEITDLQIHLEIQAGFTGENDLKKSKANDAAIRSLSGWTTCVLHFDLFNGQLSVIDITNLNSLPNDLWVKNQLFEGVATVKIPEDAFKWKMFNALPENTLESLLVTIE